MKKAIKTLATALRRRTPLASGLRFASVFLALCASTSALADFTKTNPVTGETETYTWKFTGTDTWANTASWQDSDGANPSAVPAKSGDNIWNPILFDGSTININASMSVEGWNLRMGLYNGAIVTMNTFVKYQGDTTMWMTVDETSQLTVGGFGGGNITDGQVIKLSVARANGIAWNVDLTSVNANNTFAYYLKGAGSVSYQAVSAAYHKIKMADVTLTGTSQVSSKTLVSFTSSTPTFTADAIIKLLDSNGDQVATKSLSTVNQTATLTTDDAVGSCELVQTATGIVLYWVDGDPNVLTPTVYKPSININFTSGTALSTAADVGIGEYAIPGTSWNNLIGNNGSLATLKSVDSEGTATTLAGASVTISGTRGYWTRDGLDAASDLRQGYIDDADGNASPQFVVTGIPYYKYQLVLYFSNDTDGRPFGHLTVNGTNYKWDSTNNEIVTCTGTSADVWGSSDGTAYTEGGNYLIFPAMDNTDGTLTVVGHRWSGTQRAGLAAVQIIEVQPETTENDLIINVPGDTTYTVSEAKNLSGTVYLTGNGTLTLDGSANITAATIDVGPNVVLNVNADRLDATTFTGTGTVVYNNALPVTGKGWTDSANWTGTVWINGKSGVTDFNVNSYGNANSAVKLSGVEGWISAPLDNIVPVILENGTFDYALKLTNGNSPNNQNPTRCTTFVKVSGSGTISDGNAANPMLKIYDGTEFTGTITLTRARVVFCAAGSTTLPSDYTSIPTASVYVDVGNTASVPSGKTWTANGGFVVNGTLNVDGTLASSHATKAVSGSGTVVFNGKMPSPTGDAWWKNSDWDGTVQIKSAAFTGVSGVATYLEVNKYGNDGSVLELNNCSGWLPVGNTTGDDVCAVPLKVTGTLTINDGYSNRQFTINKLLGNGAIYTTSNGATVTIQVLNADEFTGYVQLNSKRVVFGETIPETFTSGQIYIGSGFSLTVPNSNVAWYGTGGITVDGELKAAALSNFGGGTTITTTDNGVFTLTSTDNGTVDEYSTDYARIAGSGSLKYEGTGWRAISQNNLSTGLTIINEQAGDLLLHTAATYNIGSLAGSKNFQGNYGSGNRYLNIIQSKDTVWSGKVKDDNSNRLAGFKLDSTSTGTLTLSGTATQNVPLEVNGGAVNLTGTWVGATTVAGTFGGTGTLTGALTFSDGAEFKAFATDSDGLAVSGAVTVGTGVTVALGDGVTIDAETTLLTATSITGTFALDSALADAYTLTQDSTTLTIAPKSQDIVGEDGATVVGHMEGTTAVITDTSVAVKIPDGATAVEVYPTVSSSSVKAKQAQLQALSIKSMVGDQAVDSGNGFVMAPSGYADSEGYITVTITLKEPSYPAVAAGADGIAPSFTVTTVPGLWYAVKSGTSVGAMTVVASTVEQAGVGETSKTYAAPEFDTANDTVRYYTIAVGVSETEMQ